MVSRASTRPPPEFPAAAAGGGDRCCLPTPDPRLLLTNLSLVGRRVDAVRRFLADSLDRHADIGGDKLQAASFEIASAVQQIILNGAALLAFSHSDPPPPEAAPIGPSPACADRDLAAVAVSDPDAAKSVERGSDLTGPFPSEEDQKDKVEEEGVGGGDYEIKEIDAVELLAEHAHFCDICGKGFKRDANLRMHMRAHGNQFKTLEALSKPGQQLEATAAAARKTRFSCPFAGCNRNRSHKRFRPLTSAVCVKNHFRRSHCPKIYSCTRCNKKCFSVLTDLRSHLKHCGDRRWKCSCGTSFSRKDKLFGHMALFEGHIPALSVNVGTGEEVEAEEKGIVVDLEMEEEGEDWKGGEAGGGLQGLATGGLDPEFFEEFMMDGLGAVDCTAWIDF